VFMTSTSSLNAMQVTLHQGHEGRTLVWNFSHRWWVSIFAPNAKRSSSYRCRTT